MIQDKDFMIRQLKEMTRVLNSLIASFPDNSLRISAEDVSRQIYSATGLTSEDFLLLEKNNIDALLEKTHTVNRPVFLEFLGNFFYYNYQIKKEKTYLKKAQAYYKEFQSATNTFSMTYFKRMQEQ